MPAEFGRRACIVVGDRFLWRDEIRTYFAAGQNAGSQPEQGDARGSHQPAPIPSAFFTPENKKVKGTKANASAAQ